MNVDRIVALMGKELREFRANPGVIVPVLLVVLLCTVLPFLVVDVLPRLTGESFAADRSVRQIVDNARARTPELAALSQEAATEAFFYQQFLLLFLVAPIVGAVSLAAYTVVGEKQGRTLEPLLTTPLSSAELLVAKALAAFLPTLAIEAAGLCMYFVLVAWLASPGVLASLLSHRTIVLVGVLGPLASLAALQATIAVSSRVNDSRSAQIAVFVVLPLFTLLIGQVTGAFILGSGALLLLSAAVAVVWVLLVMLSVALFERETILTRWK